MLTLFLPLLLAAIAGLAVLALKFPFVYEKLYRKGTVASSAVFVALSVWSNALVWAHNVVSPFLMPEKAVEARAALDAISIPFHYLLMGYVAVLGYLWFLLWLAHLVSEEQSGQGGT